MQLITANEVRQRKNISVNVKDDRLNQFIMEAQELDIKPFLGDAMYFDMIIELGAYFDAVKEADEHHDPPPLPTEKQQLYLDLLNGKTYTDLHGHTIIYEGLKPTHELFAFARFVHWDAYRYTATGGVVKEREQSHGMSDKAIVTVIDQSKSEANAHANNVEKFLRDNKSKYPLWKFSIRNKLSRQPGARIRGIDRTRFNYPGNNYNGYYNLDNFLDNQ